MEEKEEFRTPEPLVKLKLNLQPDPKKLATAKPAEANRYQFNQRYGLHSSLDSIRSQPQFHVEINVDDVFGSSSFEDSLHVMQFFPKSSI